MRLMIWERYFLREFFRVFCLFLFCFYGLYVLIDYASHTNFLAHHVNGREVISYYLFVFASRAEILLPLALLIAFVHTVCTLNHRQELVALMASGLSLKLLMRPFLLAALSCLLLIYINEQFFLPTALRRLRRIEDASKHRKNRHALPLAVRHVLLEDGSLFIFQDYDTSQERFFDVYWIESIDSIYRMKYLYPFHSEPSGYFVDHFRRQPNGELLQEKAYAKQSFPQLHFNSQLLNSTVLEPDILSITELRQQSKKISGELSEKESKLLTAFYWKLVIPWLCLLAIIAPAPFCVRFSRHSSLFLIYACSLFGLIAFYLLLDAAQVLAKRQVMDPLWAICLPFLIAISYCGWRFKKMA